ncbi:hypothetical protein PPROV_000848700 [Pycnococcus provasolii]|uniref:Uncharacterized protein n=1 Tax=Pycnococcus provasolii TaxID=41880 RepID=A0A830HRP2_9CHLO|nr:hypothetical protein PPROV_000848700 [Pycnococcus provasolii]
MMMMMMMIALLALLFTSHTYALATKFRGKPFAVTSRPVALHTGEVFNKFGHPQYLPRHVIKDAAKKPIAVTGYKADVVEFEDATGKKIKQSAPLYDCYLHHYGAIVGRMEDLLPFYHQMNGRLGATMPMSHIHAEFEQFVSNTKKGKHSTKKKRVASIGGGSGAEERGTPHVYPPGFAQMADDIDAIMPLMHLINTKGTETVTPAGNSPLLECPCTSSRQFNYANQTIDGKLPNIPFGQCNAQMQVDANPSCAFDTYIQGYRCCEDGVFVIPGDEHGDLLNSEVSHYGMKFTFFYEHAKSNTRALRAPVGCCDVTGDLENFGNIEHDITPACDDTNGDTCVRKFVTRQYLDIPPKSGIGGFGYGNATLTPSDKRAIDAGKKWVDLVYAVGHQHVGGDAAHGIRLIRDATDEVLCTSLPKYGSGTAAGDERGYVTGIKPCIFAEPIRMRSDEVVRIESFYNTTYEHFGVMSLWILQVADVEETVEEVITAA